MHVGVTQYEMLNHFLLQEDGAEATSYPRGLFQRQPEETKSEQILPQLAPDPGTNNSFSIHFLLAPLNFYRSTCKSHVHGK
jgi:hypothetical protein